MFAACGTDRGALERLGRLMAPYANDPALMRDLVAAAEAAGFEFDD
jgi:hypothetical protein